MVIQNTITGTGTIRPPDLLTDLTRSLAQFLLVIAVILYGSAARMSTTPLSDTDLCVVTLPGLAPEEWESNMSHTGPALDLVLFHDLPPSVR
ncbi:MAG: nucleotidyltransferase domain-containing protein [Methanoregula sp.]|nr:nucleotidyltransferase domain-containing protein [Methanoregula sp.]